MRRFEGKVVLVTGAASGIGRATVERLASEGAKLFCADVQADALQETAKRAVELGAEADARVCDVSSEADAVASVAACVTRFGRLDSLCHVAGILRFAHTHEMSFADWRKIQSVNLDGTFLMCRAALPHLLASGGNIVNVSSVAALAGLAYGAAYGASKGGVLAFTRALAVEYGKQGVRVNAVCPGGVNTPLTKNFRVPENPDLALFSRLSSLVQPMAEPGEIAGAVAYLASDEARFITGDSLTIDGGQTVS